MITQKEFCGHWADEDLSRTLVFNLGRADRVRRNLADLLGEIAYIQSEQRERYYQASLPSDPSIT